MRNPVIDHRLNACFVNYTLANQPLRIDFADSGMRLDPRIHERLGIAWFVAFVMPQSTEAHDIEHDVLVELLSILEGQTQHPECGFGIVAIDVKYRQLSHAGNIGGIDRRTAGLGRGRKPNLIVYNDMDGSTGPISFQTRELKRFHNRSLARKRCVAVQ